MTPSCPKCNKSRILTLPQRDRTGPLPTKVQCQDCKWTGARTELKGWNRDVQLVRLA